MGRIELRSGWTVEQYGLIKMAFYEPDGTLFMVMDENQARKFADAMNAPRTAEVKLAAEVERLRIILGQVNSINDDPGCFNIRIDRLVSEFDAVTPGDLGIRGCGDAPPSTLAERKQAEGLVTDLKFRIEEIENCGGGVPDYLYDQLEVAESALAQQKQEGGE